MSKIFDKLFKRRRKDSQPELESETPEEEVTSETVVNERIILAEEKEREEEEVETATELKEPKQLKILNVIGVKEACHSCGHYLKLYSCSDKYPRCITCIRTLILSGLARWVDSEEEFKEDD